MKAATILITGIVVLLLIYVWLPKTEYLCLQTEDGKEYASFPVETGDTFSITFIHSVNKTPVTDFYEIREDGIYVMQTLYYGVGVGVQTQLQEGQTLTYTEDGGMLVSGFNQKMDNLAYVVGMVSDHTLSIGGDTYSRTELCGRKVYVIFECKSNHGRFYNQK